MAGHITSRGKRKDGSTICRAPAARSPSPTAPRRSKELPDQEAAEDWDGACLVRTTRHDRRLRVLDLDESGYIEDAGIEVGDAFSPEASDNQAVAALDPEDLTFHWKRLDLRD